jgi:hypothetical protein
MSATLIIKINLSKKLKSLFLKGGFRGIRVTHNPPLPPLRKGGKFLPVLICVDLGNQALDQLF